MANTPQTPSPAPDALRRIAIKGTIQGTKKRQLTPRKPIKKKLRPPIRSHKWPRMEVGQTVR